MLGIISLSPKRIGRLIKEAFEEWNRDQASLLAAALAYYTLFSIAPLLILVIAIASLFFDNAAVRDQLMGQIQSLVGASGADFLRTVLDNANRPGEGSGWLASVFSIILLLVGATGVLSQLQTSLNMIWNVEARSDLGVAGFIRKRLLSFGMILAIGFLLLVSLVISSILVGFGHYFDSLTPGLDILAQFLNFWISFGLTTLLFALIFKFMPDVFIAWNDVWLGSVATAILFSVGKSVIGLYLRNSGFGSTYGAAGSVAVLLVWVFYSAQILFFGAELTQVYARRYGSQIVPNQFAVERKAPPRP